MDDSILVTGGAGYIGSHVCKAISKAGLTPIALDNLCNGFHHLVKWGPLVEADLLDRSAILDTINTYKPLAVMHLAGLISVGESVENPSLYYRNNVDGTLNLIDAMAANDIRSIVFSSSASTYGTPRTRSLTELEDQAPLNPYGASKFMAERIIKDVAAQSDLSWMIFRYFNAAGADPDGETGECHDPETHIIPLALQAAAGQRDGFTIFGDDYDTPDGTCVRDYVHVSDLANAHLMAFRRLQQGAASDALNLGTGAGYSVRQILDKVQETTSRPIRTTIAPRRSGDAATLVADPTRANRVLGWATQHSDLDEITRTAWNWHQRMMDGQAVV